MYMYFFINLVFFLAPAVHFHLPSRPGIEDMTHALSLLRQHAVHCEMQHAFVASLGCIANLNSFHIWNFTIWIRRHGLHLDVSTCTCNMRGWMLLHLLWSFMHCFWLYDCRRVLQVGRAHSDHLSCSAGMLAQYVYLLWPQLLSLNQHAGWVVSCNML